MMRMARGLWHAGLGGAIGPLVRWYQYQGPMVPNIGAWIHGTKPIHDLAPHRLVQRKEVPD